MAIILLPLSLSLNPCRTSKVMNFVPVGMLISSFSFHKGSSAEMIVMSSLNADEYGEIYVTK
ncbi:hypothetical protein AKJ16_DCAP27447 [Drosera capensis]